MGNSRRLGPPPPFALVRPHSPLDLDSHTTSNDVVSRILLVQLRRREGRPKLGRRKERKKATTRRRSQFGEGSSKTRRRREKRPHGEDGGSVEKRGE